MSLSSTMETVSALTFRLILRNLSSCGDATTNDLDDVSQNNSNESTRNHEDMSTMQIGIVPMGQQCKLDNTSVVEGPEFAVPLEAPEPPGRPELHLGEHLECMGWTSPFLVASLCC